MNLVQVKQALVGIKTTSFGISIPELRKLAQKVARNDYQLFVKEDDYSSFELKLLHAFVLGYAKDDIKTLLKYFKAFIPQVNDWAVNDSLCQNFRIARQYPQEMWRFLEPYMKSKKEFHSRIVAVVLLSHFLNDEYIDRVIGVLDSLNTDKYYAQMGVAWAVATVMGKYPEKCLAYLNSNQCHLDAITYNKSLQKIRESFRVSKKIKEQTKQMKRL